jgi:molybdenum cofactor biosynthesis enzyme MoaA
VRKVGLDLTYNSNINNFFKKASSMRIVLTGGEPLMYSKINDVISLLKYYKHEVLISTNASFDIPKSVLEKIDGLIISIPTLDVNTSYLIREHDNINRIIDNIKYYTNYKCNITVNIVVTQMNINEIQSIIEFCEDCCISKITLDYVWPIGKGRYFISQMDKVPCLNFTSKEINIVYPPSHDELIAIMNAIIVLEINGRVYRFSTEEEDYLMDITNEEDFGLSKIEDVIQNNRRLYEEWK